jgi:hypothetical protein
MTNKPKSWQVTVHRKAQKRIEKMPKREQAILVTLLGELQMRGPVLHDWPNYSKLGRNLYHCHLSYKWVACWELVDEELRLIELYYAGSREDAPY